MVRSGARTPAEPPEGPVAGSDQRRSHEADPTVAVGQPPESRADGYRPPRGPPFRVSPAGPSRPDRGVAPSKDRCQSIGCHRAGAFRRHRDHELGIDGLHQRVDGLNGVAVCTGFDSELTGLWCHAHTCVRRLGVEVKGGWSFACGGGLMGVRGRRCRHGGDYRTGRTRDPRYR